MFYKKEYDNWLKGIKILLPTEPTIELNENNKENDFGWVWYDEPPTEYLEWEEQNYLEWEEENLNEDEL